MDLKFPSSDQILHDLLPKDAFSQREYIKLMNQCNNFINTAFQEFLDRVSRKYTEESLASILDMVYKAIEEENEKCEHKIPYDDFVKNAALVSQSLKTIIPFPSTKLIKIEKNVSINKIKRFDSKTINWLMKRPGTTIAEKTSPKNIVPTKVSFFTTDTLENRHTLYLYNILYDNLYGKIYTNEGVIQCEKCTKTDKNCYELFRKLSSIISLKRYISDSDWQLVHKEKQTKQNNKLMSDKEYKQVWDAVRDIDFYEQNCNAVWDNLKSRFQFIAFMMFCANVYKLDGIKLFDTHAQINDEEGKIWINIDGSTISNNITFFDSINNNEISVFLSDEKLVIMRSEYVSSNNVSYNKKCIASSECDLSYIFDEFINMQILENKYKNLIPQITELGNELSSIEFLISNLQLQKEPITRLVIALKDISEAINYGEEKEE